MNMIETALDDRFDPRPVHNEDSPSLFEHLRECDDNNVDHDNSFHDALVKLDAELTNLDKVERILDEEGYCDALDVRMDHVLALTYKVLGEE
jgi:nitrate reductase assembly molybdenum cofactor insertion protein NarJ